MRVIAGFPGVGKSTLCTQYHNVVDLDSALFEKNEQFAENYVNKIKEELQVPNRCVVVSVHPPLLEKMKEEGIPFYLVYPGSSLKEEFLVRYEGRKDTKDFIKQLDDNWFNYLNGLHNFELCEDSTRIVLERYENLNDVIRVDLEKGFLLK